MELIAPCVKGRRFSTRTFPACARISEAEDSRDWDGNCARIRATCLVQEIQINSGGRRPPQNHALVCAEDKDKSLAQLCNNMAKADLQLRSVGLSYLKQTSATKAGDSTRGGGVTFTVSRNKYVKVWKGSAFTQSVKDITDDMKFQWEDNNSGEDDDGLPTLLASVTMFPFLLTTER